MTAPDPTGLRYDRADTDNQPATTIREHHGWVPVKDCGHLVGDRCRCACQDTTDRIELEYAPVIVMPPFDLRALREAGITAADVDRMCPPQRWKVTPDGVEVTL